ncbi:MAG: divalent metal cation transporter [Acidimicrobiales bacterium]|jgi:NRAMP (natural resistance-associated macrophage protein)-like metal ion transporter|nr:divalent metal cation transporter [Acidimicrobiales bacterium]
MATATKSGRATPSKRKGTRSGAPRRPPVARWRQYVGALGPGLVTGASDDDPSGIATYAQVGAKFGFGMLWSALLTFPLMAAVQEMCDRTALATGKGIGELAVKRYTRRWRMVLGVLLVALMVANALNIAADLVAVGSGMHLLHAGPPAVWGLIAGVAVTALLMSGSFHLIARVFKVLCLALLSYLGVLVIAHPPWGSVASHTLIPHVQLSKDYIALLVAVLGTTISPYLFFWQSAHRMEELRDEGATRRAVPLKERSSRDARKKESMSRLDVFSGMAFSNLVMFAIIVASAQTLFHHGNHDVTSAAQAAQALKPIAGRWAEDLFALGFIGSGMLAIPVLAGAGAVGMAGLIGKSWGFSRTVRQAPVFYGLVVAGTVGGTVLSLLHVDPIHLLVLVATINGIAAAPFLVVVLRIANDRDLMGNRGNGRIANVLGWLTVALMAAATLTLLATGTG